MPQSQQICTFFLADLCLGIPVEQVQEVLSRQTLTPVPLAPPAIRGLINLRGQIVTVIDLRRCWELPDRESSAAVTHIIVQTGAEVLSLLVDKMRGVEDVDETQFEPPPDTLRGGSRELITGTYKLPQQLLLVLNVDAVAAGSETTVT